MSEIDKVKEWIGYLKIWLGIQIALAVANITWMIEHVEELSSNGQSIQIRFILSIIFLTGISVSTFLTHRHIVHEIKRLEDL